MMIYLSSESVIQLFLNLFTGHFADFNNRKRILILTDLIAGAVTFLLFLFYNPDNIWAFVIVNIIRTTENGKTVRKVNKIIKVNGFNKSASFFYAQAEEERVRAEEDEKWTVPHYIEEGLLWIR